MNSRKATTTLSGTPALPVGGKAMPKGPNPEYCAAWEKCRDLGKQLSQALLETDDDDHAFVRPAGVDHAVLFGRLESGTPVSSFVGTAGDRVERLSNQLSVALDDWNAQTDTTCMAHISPASSGRPFWFENIARNPDLPRDDEAVKRLSAILTEVAGIIHANPDLMIASININDYGVHTIRKVPGAPNLREGA